MPEGPWDALALTSPNGVEAFAATVRERHWPVLAVGDATAQAARAAGFSEVASAGGDASDLARLILAHGARRVLHPCAEEPARDLGELTGGRTQAWPLYRTRETGVEAPSDWRIALLHSPKGARALAARLSPDQARGRTACAISDAAARPLADLPFAEVRTARAPTEDALLAALGNPRPPV